MYQVAPPFFLFFDYLSKTPSFASVLRGGSGVIVKCRPNTKNANGILRHFAGPPLKWWAEAELNRRHTDFQSVALPTELSARKVMELLLNSSKMSRRD